MMRSLLPSVSSRRNRIALPLVALLACLFAGWETQTAWSQPMDTPGAAGVEVDAQGVLRLRSFTDPTGQMTRQRIAQAKAALAPDIARPSPLRKISLKRLEAAVAKQIAENNGPTPDMLHLAGLTRIQYVFFYPESQEIVIAGPAEGYVNDLSGRPVGIVSGQNILELQDLVVALRAFGPDGSQAKVIGVSIDPTQEGLAQMQEFLRNIAGRVTPNDAARIANGLKENLGLQTVTVRGISPKTHFAQIMVEADYRMKLIGIGLEEPPVRIPSYVSKANPAAVSRNAMQRWYFTPNYECVRVSDDKYAMELVGEGVKLVGEDEMVRDDGTRVERQGGGNRASQAFTTAFTNKYPELARRSPVYAQLRNVIDMSIVAAYIQDQNFYREAGWKMETFGNEQKFPVETYTTPKQVESAVNAIWKGNTLMTPIGGGVNIQPRQAIASGNMLYDEAGKLGETHKATELGDLAEGQWWWD